ncbi:MAG: alcohol dehydrogenase GroES protein [Gemmatimonadetes bacterium]|nr:alcohol dehydrogenase GroES protein [Gemmatimonadota bacterium]
MSSPSMRAALLREYHAPLSVEQVPLPAVSRDGALVRVRACGLCGSDWHVWRGDWRWRMTPALPHVMGHEIAGDVIAVGASVTSVAPGDRVTIPFHLSCGDCPWCAAGQPNLCDRYSAIGFSLPGGFAEHVAVPRAHANLVALPAGVSYRAAAALGCRYMSAWHALRDQLALTPGDDLVIVGCGGLGLAAVQVAVAMGVQVAAVDRSATALEIAARLGAASSHLVAGTSLAEDLRAATRGGSAASLEAVGSEQALAVALGALRKGGTCVRLGLTGAEERGLLPTAVDTLTKGELTLRGSLGCPTPSLHALLAEVSALRLDPELLIAEARGLDGVTEMLQAMDAGTASGIMLVEP